MDYSFDDESDAIMAELENSMNIDPYPGLPEDDEIDQLMANVIVPGEHVPVPAFPDDGVEAIMADIPVVQEGRGMSDHHIRQLISIQPDGSRFSPRWKLTFDRYTVTVRDLKDVPAVSSDTPEDFHTVCQPVPVPCSGNQSACDGQALACCHSRVCDPCPDGERFSPEF